jgi:hypothetical protein
MISESALRRFFEMLVAAASLRTRDDLNLTFILFRYLHAHLEEIFTNLSAVSVYAPSGNTGGVEVNLLPSLPSPSPSKRGHVTL